jgi:hypothetical protein
MRSRGRGGGFTVRDKITRTVGDGEGILLVGIDIFIYSTLVDY